MDSLRIDNLNSIVQEEPKQRAMPYEQYFGEMDLPKKEQKERIKQAESLEDIILAFFMLVGITTTYEVLKNSLYGDYLVWLAGNGEVDEYLTEYADKTTQELVRTTLDNQGNSWFTSQDRAMFIAENEAQSTSEYRAWKQAVLRGKKRKTWKSLRDKKVRKSHQKIDGKTIPIGEPFMLGDSLLMFPKDTSLGADARELVNCRCTAKYF